MARQIKETPVITGKDSKIFATKMAKVKTISPEEKAKAYKIYEDFKSVARFPL